MSIIGDVFNVFKLLLKNHKSLSVFLENIRYLEDVSNGLKIAGGGAKSTGVIFKGNQRTPISAKSITSDASDNFASCATTLVIVEQVIRNIANDVGNVSVPQLNFTYGTINLRPYLIPIDFTYISGSSITDNYLFTPIKNTLVNVADNIATVKDIISAASRELHNLSVEFENIGNGFNNVGDFLVKSGESVSELYEEVS